MLTASNATALIISVALGVGVHAQSDSRPISPAPHTESAPAATVQDDARRATLKTRQDDSSKLVLDSDLSSKAKNSSDAELVAFLLLAKGPLAADNMEAVQAASSRVPGWSMISDEEAVAASARYVAWSKKFKTSLRERLESPDPVVVEPAIAEFSDDFKTYIDAQAKRTELARSATASGCNASFCLRQTALAATTAVVLWQVGAVHTVGAVTIAVATVVIGYLPGAPDMASIDRQAAARAFMQGLRAK